MTRPADCPALLVSAPASGQGKTTITAALARRARRRGKRVRVFKAGPDFIDPMILQRASGAPVYQLDAWMGSEPHCRSLLRDAAAEADLLLVEGVMGLHDGEPSSAELAMRFGLPVLAVIDASAMAQTFGAVALGLAQYRPGLSFHGVLANRVGSEGHARMLAASLPQGQRFCGALPRDARLALPERHLGLVQADEVHDLEQRLDAAAEALGDAADLDGLAPVRFDAAPLQAPAPHLRELRIAVACDEALGFVYRANLDTLEAMGARLLPFSPLRDGALPDCDAVYLPGGYPELHATTLRANHGLHRGLRAHHAAGKPMLAECGGMMLLCEAIVDRESRTHRMVGLLPGIATMRAQLQALALQSANLGHGELRGHSFHYASLETTLAPAMRGLTQHGRDGEAVYRLGRLTASFVHFYFPSNPEAAAALFLP